MLSSLFQHLVPKYFKLLDESKEEEQKWEMMKRNRSGENDCVGEMWQIFHLKAEAGRGTHRFSREQPCPPQFQEGPLCCDPLFSNKHN